MHADTPSSESLIRVRLHLCRANGAVQLPANHYIDHCIEITSHDKDYMVVEVKEIAEAGHSSLESKAK